MKCAPFVLALAIWASALASSALSQPILNRIERFVRDQIGAVQSATQPTAAPGYLGLTADDRQDNGRAVRVDEVVPGGPAAQAGLLKGDQILSIGGMAVRSMDDMGNALQNQTEGTQLVFVVQRGTTQRQLEVVLGRRPATGATQPTPAPGPTAEELPVPGQPAGPVNAPVPGGLPAGTSVLSQGPRLGVRTVNVTAEAKQQNNLPDDNGAVVVGVSEGSPAARAGIPQGAVIVAFDGKPVNNPQDLATAVRTSNGRESEVVYVYGGEAARKKVSFVAVAPPTQPQLELRARPIAPPVKPRPSDAEDEGPVLTPPTDSRTAVLEARIRELEARLAQLEAERQAEKSNQAK